MKENRKTKLSKLDIAALRKVYKTRIVKKYIKILKGKK